MSTPVIQTQRARGAIILNGISRKKKKFYRSIYPLLARKFDLTVLETKSAGHAALLAAYAVSEKFDFILAAGGDGTLNQVLNGMLQHENTTIPPLGFIPLGSGNDFARTCHLSSDPHKILEVITQVPKDTDVGQLACFSEGGAPVKRYFINCCSVGLGPDVVQRREKIQNSLGPALDYLLSIVGSFLSQKLPHIKCSADGWTWEGNVRVAAVANAKSFGDAVFIAPDAVVDDGWLNMFVAGDFSTPRFLAFLILLKLKKKINNKGIFYRESRTVGLSATQPCFIETEGELAGCLPATITTLPKKILFFR